MRTKPQRHFGRTERTTIAVTVFSVVLVIACVGWALLAQVAVPNACSYHPPPAHTFYLHC